MAKVVHGAWIAIDPLRAGIGQLAAYSRKTRVAAATGHEMCTARAFSDSPLSAVRSCAMVTKQNGGPLRDPPFTNALARIGHPVRIPVYIPHLGFVSSIGGRVLAEPPEETATMARRSRKRALRRRPRPTAQTAAPLTPAPIPPTAPIKPPPIRTESFYERSVSYGEDPALLPPGVAYRFGASRGFG